jgi:pyruvate dehydrogenase (quinone)
VRTSPKRSPRFASRASADCGSNDRNSAGPILDEALATPGPVIVQGIVDPFEPPLPGKVTVDQAAKFARSLMRGEPDRERLLLTVLGDRVQEIV